MKLPNCISRLWPQKKALELNNYIEIEPRPTAQRESAGFIDPAILLKNLDHKDRLQDIGLKKKFANMACRTVGIWVWMLLFVTFFQGMGKIPMPLHEDYIFKLDEWAFVAVFTTTTAAVFGLARLVGMYLFPIAKKDKSATPD